MSNTLYNSSIIKGHTYSRQPLAEGQKFLDQMPIKSGHNINEFEIRGELIPEILSLAERDEKFLITDAFNKRVVGGPIGSNFTKIIKFIDKGTLREIPNSNGESFQVIDENGNPICNFIDPSDRQITPTKLSDGYTIQIFDKDGTTPISINFGWTFNSLNGIVHFSPDFKPKSAEWINQGFSDPVIEGFIYIGKSTSDNLNKVVSDIKITKQNIDSIIDDTIAIQPFKFSTDQMVKIGESYPKAFTCGSENQYEMFQRVTFIVPGYCFEITSLDTDETFLTEMRHLPNGDTQIFMDILWDIKYDKPIIKWEDETQNLESTKVPVLGKYSFLATTFVKNNGEKINVKPVVDFDNDSFDGFSLESYEYMMEYDEGWKVPTTDDLIEGGVANSQADSSINVNINLN